MSYAMAEIAEVKGDIAGNDRKMIEQNDKNRLYHE